MLVVMLYGTAPLVYSQGRYSWLYKHIGIVQYVNSHSRLNRYIDIYHNWPGFFALASWFGKVAGVGSPLEYAKWAQLVFELAALPLLYLAYEALSLGVRQRWVALMLYSSSNWIGQDYYSPQALGTLLSLGIMAIALRWLYVGNSSAKRMPGQTPHVALAEHAGEPWTSLRVGQRGLICAVLLILFFVLTFTHELSPYILATQLAALAVARLLRPGWLPIALAVIAFGYLLPRFNYVNSRYGLEDSIGQFLRNAAPPSAKTTISASQHLIQRCEMLLSLGMWGVALVGAWLHRRSGRSVLALLLLAFSPLIVLLAQAYGNEGILRAYLFSLPWTAALAASMLAPMEARTNRIGLFRRQDRVTGIGDRRLIRAESLRIPLAIAVVLALFFPSFFGDDSFNVMSQNEVTTVTSFFRSAHAGPVFLAASNAPASDTFNYNLFPLAPIFGNTGSVNGMKPANPDIANVLAFEAVRYTGGSEPAYVLVTPSMIAYNESYQSVLPRNFTILLDSLSHSRHWRLVTERSGTFIYELPPTAPDRKFVPGPGNFTVP